MYKKKNPRRNREKDVNLAGLYAIDGDTAFENGKPKKGVYGCVEGKSPFITKPRSRSSGKPPEFFRDLTGGDVPKVLKNRILAFQSDKNNKNKSVCYLAEKSLYEEMVGNKKKK